MEAALNLCWTLVVGLLCIACLVARSKGALRVSLGTALACSILLAVLLFPAISMTDDLQRVNLEAEVGIRSMLALLPASITEPPHFAFAALAASVLALIVRLLMRFARVSSWQDRLPQRVLWYRPAAVRPPTMAVSPLL